MPPEPVPADPGWDEDLAWLDRDPERETWLDRAREHDEPPGLDANEDWEDFTPLTAEELAEAREGAAAGPAVLAVRLPGTAVALRDGLISRYKAQLIAHVTALLDEAESRAAEAEVLDRAGRLTPGSLRAAIARAVMEVAPEKAKKRREAVTQEARVERWAEDSGNAALMGRELPSDEVLAADQRISAWATELRKAGLEGGMDELRARAYLDLLLGKDSRPRQDGADPAAQPPVPSGFGGRVTLTVPLATITGLADRPGELAGLGPIDPWLARDLATAAAANPKSTWCVTVTDEHGHAVGHGCARPGPKNHRERAGPGLPGFTFTPASRDGPPGGYGTWRLHAPGGSPRPGGPTPPNPRGTPYERPKRPGRLIRRGYDRLGAELGGS